MREIFLIWFQHIPTPKSPKESENLESVSFKKFLTLVMSHLNHANLWHLYGIWLFSGWFSDTWDQQSQFNVITVFCNTNCWISHSITFIPSTFFSFSNQTFRYVLTGPRHLASFALLPKTQEVRRQFEMQQTLGRLKGWFWGLRKLFFCLCQECKFTRLAMLVMSLSI